MIKAIETSYAGCRFRSRLEARWAVALDALDIRWEYEAQGFMCFDRISMRRYDETSRRPIEYPYLPDFWLPEEKCFLEVKGSLTRVEHLDVLDRAASLCDRTDARFILAGPIPRRGSPPVALHMRKGCLFASPGLDSSETDDGYHAGAVCLAHDTGGDWESVTSERCDFGVMVKMHLTDPLNQVPWPFIQDPRLTRAYQAARSARFEHGERG